MNRQRIGVYGGTFDPIHTGHLKVADAILDAFQLDRMLFVPAFVPPHKRKQTISPAFHRLAMLVLATTDRPRMFVSTIELEAPERPYTIETLRQLRTDLGDVQLFFVMGADSFQDITIWFDYETLLKEFDCVVAMRPGYLAGGGEVPQIAAHLARHLQERVTDLRGNKRPNIEHANGMVAPTRLYLTDYVAVGVSATQLRELVARENPIEEWVPKAVADYIAKYGLYQNS
ncbi:MAG: nicotinate-nucleotide adenylyltransferase [Blastocatellia bacterium]